MPDEAAGSDSVVPEDFLPGNPDQAVVQELQGKSDTVTTSGELIATAAENEIVIVKDAEDNAVGADNEPVVHEVIVEGLVKRWSRKVISWIKRVFRWGSRKSD